MVRELPEHYPFLDWIRGCEAAAARRSGGASKVLEQGFQTAAMRRRNAFLLSVMDDGAGQLDVQHGGGGGGRVAFRKGHVAAVHYPHERPQHIQWEIPAQFASRMVQVWRLMCMMCMIGSMLSLLWWVGDVTGFGCWRPWLAEAAGGYLAALSCCQTVWMIGSVLALVDECAVTL